MNRLYFFCLYSSIAFILTSCEFRCNIGDTDDPKGTAVVREGARVYNDIQLKTNGVSVEKAYLVFENGDPVPESNVVSFDQPVLLKLTIDSGWQEENNKVLLGASEKIMVENANVLLDEKDLFSKYPDGLSASDAKKITLTARIIVKQKMNPLTTFLVEFRVWDKVNGHSIDGSYKLFSK